MRVIFLRSQSQIFPTILPIVSPVNIVFPKQNYGAAENEKNGKIFTLSFSV